MHFQTPSAWRGLWQLVNSFPSCPENAVHHRVEYVKHSLASGFPAIDFEAPRLSAPERANFVTCALPNRQRAIASGSIGYTMQDLLQQVDLDYYRSALLLVARAELERLREERSAGSDVERRSKTFFGAVPTADGAASPEVAVARLPCGAPGKVRCE
jgi:hypothetical protein